VAFAHFGRTSVAKRLLPARFATSAAAAAARTAAATAPVATETTAAPAMTGPLGPRPRFVYVDCPAIQAGAIERRNRAVRFRRIRHLNKGEAAGLARIAIPDQIDPLDGPVLFEQVAD